MEGSAIDGNIVPRRMFFTRGVGRAGAKLSAFEFALRGAGIEKFNLVRVSSIVPPNIQIVQKDSALQELKPGGITFLVMSKMESNEPNRLIAASVGVALPRDRGTYGYLSEYEAYGENDAIAGKKAEELAASMLASTLGVEFDVDSGWDEKEQVFRMSSKIVKTSGTTQSAVVGKEGQWTCVVAAAVFVL